MTMMFQIAKSRVIWTASVLIAAYLVAQFVIPYSWMAEVLNAVRAALALMVMIVYAPIALEAVVADRIVNTHQLVLGIEISASGVLLISLWSAYGRLYGIPTGIAESSATGLFVWMMVLGYVLHITAPGAAEHRIPLSNWRLVLVAAVAGGAVGGAILWRYFLAAGVGLGLISASIFFISGEAQSHSFYDPSCCSGRDCHPIAMTAVVVGHDGYHVNSTGEIISFRDSRIRPSPDGGYHRCSYGGRNSSRTICLYVPQTGS